MEISNILTAGLSPDQNTRQGAEETIKQYASQNFSLFLMSCAKELSDESKISKNRQLAATLIKNMLLNMPNFSGRWEQLPDIDKTNIKNNILFTLASPEKDIRKAAALVVAGKNLTKF